MPQSIATLGDLIDGDFWLAIHCNRQAPPCDHHALIDVAWLAGRVGRDHSCMSRDLQRLGWRCSKCGSRAVTFRTSPRWTGPPR
jgi:hypothetical protein